MLMNSITTISGNIGCGKTTIVERLLEECNGKFKFYKEPLDSWGSWLDLFYTNPNKYAFPFQMKVLIDFLYFDEKTVENNNIITERCPLDSLYVFTKTLKNENKISYMEYNLYAEYVHKIGWKPKHIIYIKTDAKNCINRINCRMRDCESGIDSDYIHNLETFYNEWINNNTDDEINIHIVDGNQCQESVYNQVKKVLATIYNYTD